MRAWFVGIACVASACSTAPTRTLLDLPPFPDERHGHRAEFLDDGRLVVFGGFDDANRAGDRGGRTTWIHDPAVGGWTRGGDLAQPMQFHGSCVVDGVIYAVSGHVERFDAERAAWTVVVPDDERIPRSHFAAASFRGLVAAAGGFRNALVDPVGATITPLADFPGRDERAHFGFVASFDGVLHVLGGYGGESFAEQSAHWAYDGARWSERAPLPRPAAAKFATWAVDADERRLLVFVGDGGFAYDARSDAWSALPASPWSGYRVMPACALRDGYLYVLGGQAEGGRDHVDVAVYDARAGAWIRPTGRS